jgi:mRNA interferase HigB
MKIVGLKTLDKFRKKHSDCRRQINEWINDVSNSDWQSFNDIKKVYPSASILNENTVIFNLKGNKYRLVTVVVIVAGRVFIEWIGTHEEYNRKKF